MIRTLSLPPSRLLSALVLAASCLSWGLAAAQTPVLPKTPLPASETQGWEFLADNDGIVTWRKEVEGSDVIAFRGEAIIEAPIAKICQVMADTKRKTEWVHKAAEARDLQIISDLERIEYNHTATPIVIKDRDFVFHAKTTLDRAKKQVLIQIKSVEHPSMPDTGKYVRGHLMNSRYIITEVSPNQTRVLAEFHADPKGSVAKWIVNLVQKAWPRNTLNGIRKQVVKTDVIEHPKIKAFFEGGWNP